MNSRMFIALVALVAVCAGCDLGGGGDKSAVDEAQFVVDVRNDRFAGAW